MNPVMHQVCLLIGSNIQPEENVPMAVCLLRKQITVLRYSSVWESAAVGSNGPNMLNAALMGLTSLNAQDLKEHHIRPLEAQLRRVRTSDKNAPRTIDIDIILYESQLLEPTLWQFAFRAVPIAEILPDYLSETGETLREAAERLVQATPIWIRKDVVIH
jgi:2-amino-4-hydroxy-6-hydroxymethyldihydropteridine diphosphokinase